MSQDQKLILPESSLLKYKNPARVSRKSEKANSIKIQEGFDPRNVCESQSTESILASIMPPRRIKIKDDQYIQEVSSAPASRIEVVQLTKQLDQQLEARGAKMTGICPVRRELFSQVSQKDKIKQNWFLFSEIALCLKHFFLRASSRGWCLRINR